MALDIFLLFVLFVFEIDSRNNETKRGKRRCKKRQGLLHTRNEMGIKTRGEGQTGTLRQK